MSKDCGISEGAAKLSAGIESAKGEIDSLIGTGVGGIADSAVNIKDKISGLTDGIGADLESMAPELPEPAFKLQDQMTNLLSNAENPTAMIQQMDEMKEKFGDKINLAAITNNAILNSFLNCASGIFFNIFLPKFVPINTAKNNGINIIRKYT